MDQKGIDFQLCYSPDNPGRAGAKRDVNIERENSADGDDGRFPQGAPGRIPIAGCDQGAIGATSEDETVVGRQEQFQWQCGFTDPNSRLHDADQGSHLVSHEKLPSAELVQ